MRERANYASMCLRILLVRGHVFVMGSEVCDEELTRKDAQRTRNSISHNVTRFANKSRLRFTLSSQFQVPNSISDPEDDMRRSSACISVDGMVVKRPMAH